MEFNIYQKTDKHAHFFFNGIAIKKTEICANSFQ